MTGTATRLGVCDPATYQLRVLGVLDDTWADYYDVTALTVEPESQPYKVTRLTARMADQAALLGLLMRLCHTGYALLSLDLQTRDTESRRAAARRIS